MNDEITIEFTVSRAALERAAEVIEETGDEFGPGMCPFPDSAEWAEFKLLFAEVVEPLLKT